MPPILASFIATLGLIGALSSPAYGDALQRAESAYSAGRFAESTELYLEKALEQSSTSANASVFHNLGLSFDRQDELGLAVASYLRAVQLQPRQGDFQYNLRFLLAKTQDKLDGNFHRGLLETLWAGPSDFVSERELYFLGTFSLLAFSVFFSLSLLVKTFRKTTSAFTVLSGIAGLIFASGIHYKLYGEPALGAVAVPKLSAYSGPTESIVIFELHRGAPFQILNTTGDWVKIELSDQKQGWVKKSGIASFGDEVVILPSHLPKKS